MQLLSHRHQKTATKCSRLLPFALLLCILLHVKLTSAQPIIENKYFAVQPVANFDLAPSFTVTHKAGNLKRTILPKLQLIYSADQPSMAGGALDGQPGVLAWKTGAGQTLDIQQLGSTTLIARSYKINGNKIIFSFPENPLGRVSLTILFTKDQQAPIFEMGLEALKNGYYSIGFDGMPTVDSSSVDFVYQPLTWSWKRFPSRFALTEEAYANTAAVFTNHDGYTEGLAVSPSSIPYRYALAAQWNNAGKTDNKFWSVFPSDGEKGNSLFGMAVRNNEGKAQPSVYAPLPGSPQSALNKGAAFSISLVYFNQPGNWQQGSSWLLSSVFKYRSERENATVSLNQTIDNMIGFAMNDVYSGWNASLKASDYSFDVPGTVKNVSALHPLSIALLTGNTDIMKRRAIPMIEYVMSREKFLYSTSDSAGQAQVPSHFLNGPCVDIGELAALDELTNGHTPAFALEANRLFGKSRQLNMSTQTGGGSWQDYLARYRLYHNAADLQTAEAGAKSYLQEVYKNYSRTFFDSPGLRDKGAGFTTDYGYRIYDLFELFLETKDSLYLGAAATGAKQLLLWTRSNPAPPAANITVNKNNEIKGIFPGRRVSAMEGAPFVKMNETSFVAQLNIPAWQTSLNGLLPEAPNTYAFGPVMLAHHAAWLLHLAHYTGDSLLRDAAYNAVIGRYANFPGYYFTSLHTDIYQRADYPMHPFHEVKYNAIFYNHVWPHLALLVDFLVSDFFYRSKGKIDFPGTFAPGYAFLTSQVYGAKKGTVMGNSNVQLWMPPHALKSDGIAFNYLMGYTGQDILIAFANTSKKLNTEHIRLNRDFISWNQDQAYTMVEYTSNGKSTERTIKNGMLTMTLPPGAYTCIRIKGIRPNTNTTVTPVKPGALMSKNRFLSFLAQDDSTASAKAMIIQPDNAMAVFYTFCNKTEKEWKECRLRYRLNQHETWTTLSDPSYPFEFEIAIPNISDTVSFEITAIKQDGTTARFPAKTIND
ncbi:MAG: hypothetical protein ABIQ88_03930 [Chitinophagaceae bacterium]